MIVDVSSTNKRTIAERRARHLRPGGQRWGGPLAEGAATIGKAMRHEDVVGAGRYVDDVRLNATADVLEVSRDRALDALA